MALHILLKVLVSEMWGSKHQCTVNLQLFTQGEIACMFLQFYNQIETLLGEGNGTPLQYSCLENPMDGGAWWAAVYGVAQSRTRLKWLSSSRDSVLLLLKSMICYMKVMTLKNPYKTYLISWYCSWQKSWCCVHQHGVSLSSFFGLITWMFIISWQILFFTEDLKQKIATRCPWWRC